MTNRENFISLAMRKGYNKVPIDFSLCPYLEEKFSAFLETSDLHFEKMYQSIPDIFAKTANPETFLSYYNHPFREGTVIDGYGVAHEPGGDAAYHMTRMYHPMETFDSTEQVLAYPFPAIVSDDLSRQLLAVKETKDNDQIAMGFMQMTVWEQAWYLRGMENLMVDMMTEDPIAEVLLDKVTDIAVEKAKAFAKSGVDALFVGDDIGMQQSIMMSETLYTTWLKPRLKRVIDAAKGINPDIIVFYHSCGFITPLIPHLIDAGVDVLNPVQPECMDFSEIHEKFGDKLSFHGTIGTQTTMPFGTPDDVRREVFKNLEIAGDKGGLFVAPTHLLEPEVPLENVVAYIRACQDFK